MVKMTTLTMGGVTHEIVDEAARADIDILKADVKSLQDKESVNVIKKSVEGNAIQVDDVSQVEHKLNVSIHSKNHLDYNDGIPSKYITNYGIINNGVHVEGSYYVEFPVNLKGGKTYVQSCVVTNSTGNANNAGAWLIKYQDDSLTNLARNGISIYAEKDVKSIFIYLNTNEMESGSADITNIQLEVGETSTEYTSYINPTTVNIIRYGLNESDNKQTYIPSSDGTVKDMMSLSPNMTILTDTDGIIVECEYNVDTKTYIDQKFEELKALIQ